MSDITYTEAASGKKVAIYRVTLPAHPKDWTLDLLRKFVRDADEMAITGATRIRRDPEQEGFSFQTDNRYYGLCLERVVEL